RLAALARLEGAERLLAVARAHIDQGDWINASDVLASASELVASLDEDTVDPEAGAGDGALSVGERILLRRAQAAAHLGHDAQVVALLAELTKRRVWDDLIATTSEVVDADVGWWMALAIAHEEAEDHLSAARVYAHMVATGAKGGSGRDVFTLQQARCAHLAGAREEAVEAYQRFVGARLARDDFGLVSHTTAHADSFEDAGADPDLVAACMELGALLEEDERDEEAANLYLDLVRHAPLAADGYARLFALRERLPSQAQRVVARAATVLRLLDPARADEIEAVAGALPDPPTPVALPRVYFVLGTQEHDEVLKHHAEEASTALAQKWLGGLVLDEPDTRDIERHCQRVEPGTFSELSEIVTHLARMLAIPTPRLYLSHGFTGIQVMGASQEPFLLMGAAHLEAGHAQALNLRQQCFTVASQMEHIRAGHLMLTSSEFWGAFRSRSLDGLVAALSLVPIGGMLGKVTDVFASQLIATLRDSMGGKMTKGVLDYADRALKQGGTSGSVQTAYEATLGRLLARERGAKRSDDSLLKEQLADFARGAMYTADRLGLIACDDLESAVRAILLLSARASAELPTLESYGLRDMLSRTDAHGQLVYTELALRLSELFKFALSPEYEQLRSALLGAQTGASARPQSGA
ncbi:MAG: hypothetical protein AAGI01_14925, partial [Myxococcota bacterium]